MANGLITTAQPNVGVTVPPVVDPTLAATAANVGNPSQVTAPTTQLPSGLTGQNNDLLPSTPGVAPASAPPISGTPANVASVTTPTATTRTIGDQETVAGQLNSLLAGDSKYLQSARNAGLAQANSRGLLNSSLAAGTAEKAAIDAAEPIAAADANTNAQANQATQQTNQNMQLQGYQSLLGSAQANENYGYTTAENAQNIKANTDLQNARIALSNAQLDEQQKEAVAHDTELMAQQVQANIQQIQSTPDVTLSAADKQIAIDYQNASLQARLNTLSSLYGYTLDWSVPTQKQVSDAAANTTGTPASAYDAALTAAGYIGATGQTQYNTDLKLAQSHGFTGTAPADVAAWVSNYNTPPVQA